MNLLLFVFAELILFKWSILFSLLAELDLKTLLWFILLLLLDFFIAVEVVVFVVTRFVGTDVELVEFPNVWVLHVLFAGDVDNGDEQTFEVKRW